MVNYVGFNMFIFIGNRWRDDHFDVLAREIMDEVAAFHVDSWKPLPVRGQVEEEFGSIWTLAIEFHYEHSQAITY